MQYSHMQSYTASSDCVDGQKIRKGIGSLPNHLQDCNASRVVQDFFSRTKNAHTHTLNVAWLGTEYISPSILGALTAETAAS